MVSEGWSAIPWASELFPAHLIAIDYASDKLLPYQQGGLSVKLMAATFTRVAKSLSENSNQEPQIQTENVEIPGSSAKLRSLLYWNPDLQP